MSHITSNDWLKWDLIHPLVYQALLENNFQHPTEIQSYVLNCYRNYNDFLIAAQTYSTIHPVDKSNIWQQGSGKTLSFGIPIVSDILYEKAGAFKDSSNPKHGKKYIRCLIIAPTRELVMQIETHLNQISKNAKNMIRIGSLVGGISKDKQRRVLSYVPDILVATPGRLWDMIDNYEHECLDQLHLLDYLVLDEADRMVELGHFDELDKILEKVYNKGEVNENKGEIKKIQELINSKQTKTIQLKTKAHMSLKGLEDMGENEVKTISGDEALKFFASLKNNNSLDPSEMKGLDLSFLDKHKEQIEGHHDEDDQENKEGFSDNEEDEEGLENEESEGLSDNQEDEELNNEEDLENEEIEGSENEESEDLEKEEIEGGENEESEDLEKDEMENEGDEDEEENDKPKRNLKIKVFLVSATLTKQFAGNKHKIKTLSKKEKKKQNKEKKDRKKGIVNESAKEDKMIPKMEALMNKIKFSAKHKVIDLTQTMLIPKNLKELKTVCIEEDKPLYLYHYVQNRPSESVIIFTNSISYAKKITHLLQILGLKVLCLHSEMQQRQRLKKLDQFKAGQYNLLVATDVAARGLDIPSVQNVVHYQVPMDIDTFIHRSGRTARIGKSGTCYTLIGPKDGDRFKKIINQLEKEQGIKNIEINHTERDKIRVLIDSAQQLEKSDFLVRQKQVEKAWYSKNSKLAELEVDDEINQEIGQINEDLYKKRIVMRQDRVEFKKVKEDVKQLHRRTNNMFLEPSQIAQYAQRMEALKAKPKFHKHHPIPSSNVNNFKQNSTPNKLNKKRLHSKR